MKKSTYIFLLIIFTCLLLGCGSSKTKTTATTKTTSKAVVTSTIKEVSSIETKYYGDTLKGKIPLPKLTEKPTVISFESGGTKLDVTLTDNSFSYKVTPKHVATTTINSVKESDTKAVADVEQVQEVKTVKIEEPWRPPWWSYVIVIVIIGGAFYYIKTKINPFKSLLKLILKLF
jgi:hypothetical protein